MVYNTLTVGLHFNFLQNPNRFVLPKGWQKVLLLTCNAFYKWAGALNTLNFIFPRRFRAKQIPTNKKWFVGNWASHFVYYMVKRLYLRLYFLTKRN